MLQTPTAIVLAFDCDPPRVEPGTFIFVRGMGLNHFVDHSLEQNPPTWTWACHELRHTISISNPIGSMYAIYGNIYHQYTPNVSIYTIHGSYGNGLCICFLIFSVGYCFPTSRLVGFSPAPWNLCQCTASRRLGSFGPEIRKRNDSLDVA